MAWVNNDGLMVRFGTELARESNQTLGSITINGTRYLISDWEYNNLPTFTTDPDNTGGNNAFNDEDVYIPVGSLIIGAWTLVETAFASGTSYNMGLYRTNGTVIDLDGIDAAVAVADMAAGDAVIHNGALVGGAALVTGGNAHFVIAATGTFTAGRARTVIEYIPPRA